MTLSCRFKALAAFVFIAPAACKNPPTQSSVKEFELSADICGELNRATTSRYQASGKTKPDYFQFLKQQEKQILAYELPRYQRRLTEMNTSSGPANGPQGDSQPLPGAPVRPSNDKPQGPTSTGFTLADTPVPSSGGSGGVSLASEVCPGCTKEVVIQRISTLQRNKSAIDSCVLPQDPAASASSTASTGGGPTSGSNSEADRQQMAGALSTMITEAANAEALCGWWGQHAGGVGANRDRCRRESVTALCTTALQASVDVGTNAATGGDTTVAGVTTALVKPVPEALKNAMIGCVQQMAYDVVKSALRDAGTRQFVPKFTQDLAQQAIASDGLSSASKQEKIAELKKQIALALCNAGTAMIASQIDAQPQINFDNPCRAVFQTSKSRAKACLNTVGSGCRIAAGDIDLRNFFPEGVTDDKPLATLAAEAGNVIASAGCETLKAGVICGAISEAGAQIRSAITSGNNDWAHCVGTDQMGACGGTVYSEWLLGVKVSDFKEPIRQPVASVEAPGYYEKEVCWCYNSCYQDDWGSDTELSRSNYYTVISRGDAGKRECQNKDGRWNWTGSKAKSGYHLYWKLHACELIKARSKNSEGFASEGGFEVQIDGQWYYKNMSAENGSCPSGL